MKIDPVSTIMHTSNFIGTKCLLAQWADTYEPLGHDLVNLNINNLLSKNAIPYAVVLNIGCLKDTELSCFKKINEGFINACKESNVSSHFGEIAQLPDIYNNSFPGRTFNLIGFGYGLIHPSLSDKPIDESDILIGLESNGLHCNGYSLVRKVLLKKWSPLKTRNKTYDLGDIIVSLGKPIEEELLQPTISYYPVIKKLIESGIEIKGMANVQRGGISCLFKFIELNNVGFRIWNFPEASSLLSEIQRKGNISNNEMFRTFNMGIGFYITVGKEFGEEIINICKEVKIRGHILGESVDNKKIQVDFQNKRIIIDKPTNWSIY